MNWKMYSQRRRRRLRRKGLCIDCGKRPVRSGTNALNHRRPSLCDDCAAERQLRYAKISVSRRPAKRIQEFAVNVAALPKPLPRPSGFGGLFSSAPPAPGRSQ